MKLYYDFINELNYHHQYHYGNMLMIMESTDECSIGGFYISRNILSTLKRYYESTNSFNKVKISKMINKDIKNVDVVYEMILTVNGD